MTHFSKMICISIAITKKNYNLACLLNFASNGFCCVRLCTNVDKTINLFSRVGMRNEWSSRISAMLDITIEDDERVSPYVCYKYTRRLSLLEKAIEDRKAFMELAISSLNAQMKKRTRVASADIGVSPDTVRLRPSAKLSWKKLVFECKYDQNV